MLLKWLKKIFSEKKRKKDPIVSAPLNPFQSNAEISQKLKKLDQQKKGRKGE